MGSYSSKQSNTAMGFITLVVFFIVAFMFFYQYAAIATGLKAGYILVLVTLFFVCVFSFVNASKAEKFDTVSYDQEGNQVIYEEQLQEQEEDQYLE